MQDIITLHCGVDNCNTHYVYEYSEEKVVAIAAQWRSPKAAAAEEEGVALLPAPPLTGETYVLQINFPLKINLAQHFWATYFEPATEEQGLDSESGINSLLFCLCRKKRIVAIAKKTASIEIEVIRVKKITDKSPAKAETAIRTALLEKELGSSYVSVENFTNFSLIRASFQGDCGWTYIVRKENGRSTIVAENQWDFHQDTWLLVNEEISKEQVDKYGI